MVNSRKNVFAALTLLLAPACAFAGEGTTAADYLNIDPSARSTAMGSAYAAAGDDAFAFYHNPAGLALVSRAEVALSHVPWVEDMHSEYGVVALPLKNGLVLSAGGSYFSSGSMDKLDSDGNAQGSYDYNGVSGGVSLAKRYGDMAFGVTAKTVREAMDGASASTFAADAGALYFGGPLTLGLALQNYGGSLALGSSSASLPKNFAMGASWRYSAEMLLACEYDKPMVSGSSGRAYAGAEYTFEGEKLWRATMLRGGWNFSRDVNTGSGVTFGLGLRLGDNYTIDYAMVPMGDFGSTQRISLKIAFGEQDDASVAEFNPEETDSTPAVKPAKDKKKKANVSMDDSVEDYRSGKISMEELRRRMRETGFN